MWSGRINIIKMTLLPKAIYKFNAITIKLSMAYFHRPRTKKFKNCMETQKTSILIVKAILRKKNGDGGIRHSDLRLCYKAIVIKTVWGKISVAQK